LKNDLYGFGGRRSSTHAILPLIVTLSKAFHAPVAFFSTMFFDALNQVETS
jgi:hypothetical protein